MIHQMLYIKFTFVLKAKKKNLNLNRYDNIGKCLLSVCLLSVCLNDKLNTVCRYFMHLSNGTFEIKPMISYQNNLKSHMYIAIYQVATWDIKV